MGGLTDVLTRQKQYIDDGDHLTKLLTIDRTKLTGPELKELFQSRIQNAFLIGDVIDTGNGWAICIAKNVKADKDAKVDSFDGKIPAKVTSFNYHCPCKGDTYDYLFWLIPKTRTKQTEFIDPSVTKESEWSYLTDLYAGMNEVKDVIENTTSYGVKVDVRKANKSDASYTIYNYEAYRSTYYLHLPTSTLCNNTSYNLPSPGFDQCALGKLDTYLSNLRDDIIYKLLTQRLGYLEEPTQSAYQSQAIFTGYGWFYYNIPNINSGIGDIGNINAERKWYTGPSMEGTSLLKQHQGVYLLYNPGNTDLSALFFIGKQS